MHIAVAYLLFYMCISTYICKYLAATSTPTLLIGYYHGLLLRNINADDLIDQMISNGLLTDTKQTIVSDGHSVHQRNWLLLECARHFKMQHLLIFCELVQSIYSVIGLQLIAGIATYFIFIVLSLN